MDSMISLAISRTQDAKRTALVQRDVLARSQRYLFKEVTIDKTRRPAAAWMELFNASPHLLTYVRVVTLDLSGVTDTNSMLFLMQQLVTLGYVHTLLISRATFTESLCNFLIPFLPRFRTIKLNGCTYDGRTVGKILHHATSLSNLEIGSGTQCKVGTIPEPSDDDGTTARFRVVDEAVSLAHPPNQITRFVYHAEWLFTYEMPRSVANRSHPHNIKDWLHQVDCTVIAHPPFLMELIPRLSLVSSLQLVIPSAVAPFLNKILECIGGQLETLDLTVEHGMGHLIIR